MFIAKLNSQLPVKWPPRQQTSSLALYVLYFTLSGSRGHGMPTMHQSLGQRGNVTVFTGLIDIQHIAAAYRAEARVRIGLNTRPSFVFQYYCPLTRTKNDRRAGCETSLAWHLRSVYGRSMTLLRTKTPTTAFVFWPWLERPV